MTKIKTKSGQTLTTLLVFIAIAVTITTGAVAVMISGARSAGKLQDGVITLQIAESAAENALLRLIRDSSYAGETMTIDGGSATIAVTGTTTKTINVAATYGNHVRKLRIFAGYSNGILTVTPPWTEVFP